MPWRLADSLEVLRDEVNERWPQRSRASDGTIGDAAHASTGSASDHNPWITDADGIGVVRAFDITSEGIDADWLAEHLRALGAGEDPRLGDSGYVIWSGRIASVRDGWVWRPYDGADPHTSHIHLSVTRDPAHFDDTHPWGVLNYQAQPQAPQEDDDDMAKIQLVTCNSHPDASLHGVVWKAVDNVSVFPVPGGSTPDELAYYVSLWGQPVDVTPGQFDALRRDDLIQQAAVKTLSA